MRKTVFAAVLVRTAGASTVTVARGSLCREKRQIGTEQARIKACNANCCRKYGQTIRKLDVTYWSVRMLRLHIQLSPHKQYVCPAFTCWALVGKKSWDIPYLGAYEQN
jgi:hypothetical protein